ncbi:hypothetical protein CIB48_g807 [Xylaria polymorpha]|nr:hypothetical protein CIB48_g807 [Xylaria polymorpha]
MYRASLDSPIPPLLIHNSTRTRPYLRKRKTGRKQNTPYFHRLPYRTPACKREGSNPTSFAVVMQLVGSKTSQRLEEVGEGSLTLLPTDPEDMWHANNLIGPQDVIKAHAIRKVTTESKTGSTVSERVHTDLTIRVTSTFFDPAASQLHVSGTVIVENAFVNIGQYHTLDLELNRPFTLWKKYGWDSVARETLSDALKQDKDGAVAAVVMQEGIANICLITEFRTVLKQRVESAIPKKRSASSDQDSGMRRFFDKTLSTLMRSVDFANPRPLLLASPGLNEILKSTEVTSTMKDMKFSKETRFMDDFFDKLRKDDGRAWYGTAPVERAVQEGAVGRGGWGVAHQQLAVSKPRHRDAETLRVDGGQAGGGVDALGGIAALLTYPILDLDEDEDEQTNAHEEAGNQELII